MAPESIDRYKIQEEIGRGGMATVYKAHDPLFERTVAIKVMPPEFSRDPEFRARFIREARTIAALEHPAIVPVYDYGEDYNQPYLVMRYMPGGSLSDRLRRGAVSLADTAVILQRIGSALDAAHGKGLIHRDLKPGNILFDQYGDAYLADFGIVHVAASEEALTATGGLVGTPSYMSPEQVHGDLELDGRSDIYALGIILFQMLAGTVPYAADTPAKTMMQHVLDPVPPILNARPDLPAEFDAIINKAMAKDRNDRYPTGGELTTALNALVAQSGDATLGTVPSAAAATPSPPPRSAIPRPEKAAPLKIEPEPEPAQPAKSGLIEAPSFPKATAQPPKAAAQPKPSGRRRLSPAFWVGMGVLVLVCLGVVGAIGWIVSNLPDSDSSVIVEDRPAVVTVEVIEEVDTAGTSTAESLAATREQLALEAAEPTLTATAVPPTPEPTDDDARAKALATRQALATAAAEEAAAEAPVAETPVIERPSSDLTPLFGPSDGEMSHEDDSRIESVFADASPADFIMRARFGNPFAANDDNPWDIGLTFRQGAVDDELRLVVHSDGFWNLNDRDGSEDNFIQEGDVTDWLDLSGEGGNDLLVAALGERGYFFLNGRFISTLDLSSRTKAGDLAIGTGFYGSSEQVGSATGYSDFAIWPGEALFGPESGAMEHIDDSYVKDYAAGVGVYNFIAAAEFGVPYTSEIGPWDVGFDFRDADVGEQYWLIVESTGDWSFFNRENGEDALLDEGVVENLDTNAEGSNRLLLIALDDTGYFSLNDELVADLDLSARVHEGNVVVVTAFFEGNEIEGYTTPFTDFTVWGLP
ncbi:MAG: serine/threonine protein kinase [Chloroflexi bacterium]|nr:serine/threonine protein kinase [Chloroflexota bacterium]